LSYRVTAMIAAHHPTPTGHWRATLFLA